MKKLRIVLIGLLLAGAAALVGCSRYNTAHESQGKGRNSELAGRNLEQGDRGRNNSTLDKGFNAPGQSGKSVVDIGSIDNLSGTLISDGSEWYLDTGKEQYILQFGNSAYVESTGIDLQEGNPIEVRGFVSGEEVAVVAARLNSQVYAFRNENGTPLWAGGGRRDNQIAQPYGNGNSTDQRRGRSGQGGEGGRGRGQGTEGGTFDRRDPGRGSEQQEGRGRGREPEDSQEPPWWNQQPLEPVNPQTQT